MGGADPNVSGTIVCVAACVLLATGVPKLRRPERTAGALRSAGIPAAEEAARMVGLLEVAVGAACLVRPSTLSYTCASVLFAIFACFVLAVSRLTEPPPDCGCTAGGTGSPPHPVHALLDLALAVGAGAAAFCPPAGASAVIPGSPALALAWAAGVCAAAVLVLAALETLPAVLLSYRAVSAEGNG